MITRQVVQTREGYAVRNKTGWFGGWKYYQRDGETMWTLWRYVRKHCLFDRLEPASVLLIDEAAKLRAELETERPIFVVRVIQTVKLR